MNNNDLSGITSAFSGTTRRLNRRRDAGAVIVNAAPCDCDASGD